MTVHPFDGVVLNALAFSTLLSSQVSDAHHPGAFALFRGNPSNLPVGLDRVKSLDRTFSVWHPFQCSPAGDRTTPVWAKTTHAV